MTNSNKSLLAKNQRIRLINSTWAAGGGVLLSFVAYYSTTMGLFLGDKNVLIWVLVGFWLGNFAFIGTIASGLNKRFRDPALTLPQMYWAVATTNIALMFTTQLDVLYYLLIMLTMVFGIFRLSVRQFNVFCYFAIAQLLTSLLIRYSLYASDSIGTLIINWVAFAFCAITLTSLCNSIVRLRFRLKQKNEELSEALKAKSEFLANMSHEIRTPMNGVIGMLDVALLSETSPEKHRYLSVARNSAQSLLGIINDILDFSKVEAGKLELEAIDTDIDDLVHEVLVNFSGLAEPNDVELIADISPTISHLVKCDPGRIKQILNNLVGNALKFTPHGEVLVKARAEKLVSGRVQLHFLVRDTGIGIAAQNQKHLFDSFTQADTSTTRKYGGTGLGLSIAKRLCETMNGAISLESYEGKGSTFSFFIEVEASEERPPKAILPEYIRDFRVLVVDDNATSRAVITKYLEYLEVHVVAVENGKQALTRLANNTTFDAVIIDRQMPGMTGDTLAQQIRMQQNDERVPIIMLSNMKAEGASNLITELRLAAYITKPLRANQLYTALGFTFNSACYISDNAPNSDTADTPIDTAPPPTTTKPTNKERKKILLVEDNKTNQEVALLTLEILGYNADVANNGGEAIEILKQQSDSEQHYGAILMDCQMPVLDGYKTTETIRSDAALSAFKYIPIIALTANALRDDKEKCLAAGMNDFLSKPIDSTKLGATLAHWLHEETQQETSPPTKKKSAVTEAEESQVWNRAELERLVGNNAQRAYKLISGFVASLVAMRTELEAHIDGKRYSDAANTLHGLKGAASNMRVNKLAEAASNFEHALKHESTSAIANTQEHFVEQLEIAVSHLSEYLETHEQ
ncbi:response regulator [Saccharophagus degradans]|uniref:Sensory/regulatory protein RpfC n=1 Tax=Saccharophagus degradans TaxID=86304 RepID=A0AAW7X4M4_9GAMM|nr:response regulator [Saccharophagus degradans]MDO6421512.1 response regulator [Saccharophagus degradans]MDO6608674.1 response regulator [Saccharophagus degradans]